ncbi:MAG: zinc-binding dehydrogenase [Candidatus Elarobacter sp.]
MRLMRFVNAVVVDKAAPGGLSFQPVAEPVPLASEALIRVAAISLNLGEVRRAKTTVPDGWRIGWDFAGTVERAAADGSGPPLGARVVGMLNSGAWAERLAVPSNRLAVLPDALTFERAATLPIAGLTALFALERHGTLLGKRVLVTGASGGVGVFALQLARIGGATTTALVHRAEKRDAVMPYAHAVFAGTTADVARDAGPFDIVLESVGGDVFAGALTLLAENGTLVTFGTSADKRSTVDVAAFYSHGGLSIYGFIIFAEIERRPAGPGLERLASLMASGALDVHIDDVLPVARVGEAADRLWNRGVTGKLVVTF